MSALAAFENSLISGEINPERDDPEFIYFDTGIPLLNAAIGRKQGIPTRSIIQIAGEPKSGKTTLALQIFAQAQKNGVLRDIDIDGKLYNGVLLNIEYAYDAAYAKELGVDVSKLLIVETVYAEDAFNIAIELIEKGIQFVLVDSISVIVSKAEEDKDFNDNEKVASDAKVIARFTKHLLHITNKHNALVIFINQVRANISTFSRKEKKLYGTVIMHYLSKMIITVARVKNEDDYAIVEASLEKNKFGAEGRSARYNLRHGHGIDTAAAIIDAALLFGIVTKSGNAVFVYNDIKARGMKNATELFPIDEIRSKVMEQL